MDLFAQRTIDAFPPSVKEGADFLTISGKYKLIGSAKFEKIKYYSDFDLNEHADQDENSTLSIKKSLDRIYDIIKKKYIEAKSNPDIFIVDLKCGLDSNGDTMHWTAKEVLAGQRKKKDGTQAKFVDVILDRTAFKMDIIKLIDGIYVEMSDNYYIRLKNGETNIPIKSELQSNILYGLADAFGTYYYGLNNKFKGIKRAFAFYYIENPTKNKDILIKLFNYFNTPIGLLYKVTSELKTLQTVLYNKFRGFRSAIIRNNILNIAENLKPKKGQINDLRIESARNKLIDISKIRTFNRAKVNAALSETYTILLNIVNGSTRNFVEKNPRAVLYTQ